MTRNEYWIALCEELEAPRCRWCRFFAPIILPWFVSPLIFHEAIVSDGLLLFFVGLSIWKDRTATAAARYIEIHVQKAHGKLPVSQSTVSDFDEASKRWWSFKGRLHVLVLFFRTYCRVFFSETFADSSSSSQMSTEAQFGAAAALCTPSCGERTATAGHGEKGGPIERRMGWGDHPLKRIEHTGAHAK